MRRSSPSARQRGWDRQKCRRAASSTIFCGTNPRAGGRRVVHRREDVLPLESVRPGDDSEITTTYSDWRNANGWMTPYHAIVTETEIPNSSETSKPFGPRARCRKTLSRRSFQDHRTQRLLPMRRPFHSPWRRTILYSTCPSMDGLRSDSSSIRGGPERYQLDSPRRVGSEDLRQDDDERRRKPAEYTYAAGETSRFQELNFATSTYRPLTRRAWSAPWG